MFGPTSRNRFGKPATRRAAVGLRAARPRRRARRSPSRPRTSLANGDVGDVEAGREDDRVDLVRSCRRGDDAVRADLRRCPSVTTSTFGCGERRIAVVGQQDPLAADRVVGRELARAARGRGPARRGAGGRSRSASFMSFGLVREARARAARASSRRPRGRRAAAAGNAAVERALDAGDRPVAVRHDPRRRALEDGRGARPCGWISGTIWIAEAPVPIDRDALGRSGRGRGPSARSGTSRPRSPRGRGRRGSTARSARPARRRGRRRCSSPCGGLERARRAASSSHAAPVDLAVEADVVARRRSARRSRAGSRGSRAAAEYVRVQSGLGANENEYRCDGMSHWQPG